jgi:imidazolonepropionase-like amidohydrolase
MELAMMAEAGLTPEQVLRSATADAARCLGIEDVGTLEKGKAADFIVVDGNPLEAVSDLRKIDSVWIAGNRVPQRASE